MTRPTISVVIPAYNVERFLHRTLASVMRQTCQPHEIVLVDDGSTDSSVEIARAYPGVKVLQQSNVERGATRNHGIRAAEGLYIALLDGDDEWLPEHLERAAAILLSDGATADVACGAYDVVAADGSIKRTRNPWPSKWFDDPVRIFRSVDSGGLCASNVVARRSVLLATPFSEIRAMSGSEDWHCWARLGATARIRSHPAVTCRYHLHGGNSIYNVRQMAVSMRAAVEDLSRDARFRPFAREARRSIDLMIAAEFRGARQNELARRTLRELAHRDPASLLNRRWWLTALRSLR